MSKRFGSITKYAVLLTAILLFFSHFLSAQTVTGMITGSIADPSGLAVAGATVTLTNEATGVRRVQNSSATGDFVFSAVLPGQYTVAVEAKGFKRVEKQHLNITASERLSAGQFALEVGSLTRGDHSHRRGHTRADHQPGALRGADQYQVSTLMVRGRDFFTLIKVLPGVVPPSEMESLGRTPLTWIQGHEAELSHGRHRRRLHQ